MSKQQMRAILEMLNTAYGSNKFPLNNKISNLWYDLFKDLPFEDVEEAAKRYIKSSEFSPTIAGIMKEYNGLQEERSEDVKKIVALRNNAIDDYPTYREPNFSFGAACRAFMKKAKGSVDNAVLISDCMERKTAQIHNGADYIPIVDFIRSLKI